MQAHEQVRIETRGAGLYEFTGSLERFVAAGGIGTGLLTVFCRHTSCSLIVQENADPSVRADIEGFFSRLVPEGMAWIGHTAEGPDDMPAHIRAALTQASISIPVTGGAMALGTWQGVYLFEHRSAPHTRTVALHLAGEP